MHGETVKNDYFVVPLKLTSDISNSKAADLYLGGDRIEFRPEHRRLILKGFVVLRSPSWKLPEAAVTECSVLHHEYKKITSHYIPGY